MGLRCFVFFVSQVTFFLTQQAAARCTLHLVMVGKLQQSNLGASPRTRAGTIPGRVDLLFRGRLPVTSLSSLAQEVGRNRFSLSVDKERVACGSVQGSAYLWSTLFAKAEDLIQNHGWTGMLFGRARKYDETPHRIRLLES